MSNTVKTLQCPNGSVVHVVGTAHFSKESIEDVRRTVRETKPNVVVLELCQNRQAFLAYNEEDLLQQAQTMDLTKMRTIIRREGLVPGLTQSIFLKVSAELTQKLGMAPGGEFRAGYQEAMAINARVVLGDRLIGITFKRAISALSFWQGMVFTYQLLSSLSSGIDITPEDIERMKTQDMVQMMMGELGNRFPAIVEVFMSERDQILAYSLMLAANCAQQPYGPPVTVVGVMGLGHLQGIENHWNQTLDIRNLLTVPERSGKVQLLLKGSKLTFKLGLISLCVYGTYFISRKVYSYLRFY